MSTDKIHKSKLSEILSRLMEPLKCEYEYQVGELIGIKKSALSQRKKRGSLPVDKIELICIENGLNVEWAMTGEGDMFVFGDATVTGNKSANLALNGGNHHIDVHNGDGPALPSDIQVVVDEMGGMTKRERLAVYSHCVEIKEQRGK